jgi:hypothetical protein
VHDDEDDDDDDDDNNNNNNNNNNSRYGNFTQLQKPTKTRPTFP